MWIFGGKGHLSVLYRPKKLLRNRWKWPYCCCYSAGMVKWVGKYVLKNIPQGTETTCYVALNPQVKGVTGEYFSDSNIAKPISKGQDTELGKKLWEFSVSLKEPQQLYDHKQ